MKSYIRLIQSPIEKNLFNQKIIIIYGARQVGKTTLARAIQQNFSGSSIYLNCDEPDIRQSLTDKTSTALGALIGRNQLVVIDEAQRVKNIGITLKLLVDTFPERQFIATGSSAFDLSNQIKEPLTGRKIEFELFPLSVAELLTQESPLENQRLLEHRLRYGAYPGVISGMDAEEVITEIASSTLFRDVLEYQVVRNPQLVHRLLQALALQMGSEVSYTELGSLLGIDKITVERYLGLLQQAYVVFQLPPFSRNLRKELGKMRKIYFYDLGVRNALINNFNPLESRTDVGALWENYVISERVKWLKNNRIRSNIYFWRTYDKAEIDYLEEREGKLFGLECKWAEKKWRIPSAFTASYTSSDVRLVNRENYLDYLT